MATACTAVITGTALTLQTNVTAKTTRVTTIIAFSYETCDNAESYKTAPTKRCYFPVLVSLNDHRLATAITYVPLQRPQSRFNPNWNELFAMPALNRWSLWFL